MLTFSWQATASQDCYSAAYPESDSRLCPRPRLRGTHLGSVIVSRIKDGHITDQPSAFRWSLCLEVGCELLFSIYV
jgi:hypothetical protein